MTDYSEEQVEEIVQEAVAKTEKSFGGTFKRLKSENEELRNFYETAVADHEAAKKTMEQRIEELQNLISESKQHISELVVKGELDRQLREKGPLPEQFVSTDRIVCSDDPETLRENVAKEIDKGARAFEKLLSDTGIALPQAAHVPGNPTNPPSRNTATSHNLKRAEAQDVLRSMTQRGLIR
ncbi:hypothetical protein ACFL1R_07345 [Candidatus Latescibacterota bacterium]